MDVNKGHETVGKADSAPPSPSGEKKRGRHRFRIVVPAYPAFNIYSRVARGTTALGPVCVASVVNKMPAWDVEIIDENNYRRYGPKTPEGMPDHQTLQALRPADVVGFYGGLSSTIPRLFQVASIYKEMGVHTIAGGQHFVEENIEDGLAHSLDVLVLGEAAETIGELLTAIVSGTGVERVAGIAFRENGQARRTEPRPPLTSFDQFPIPDFSLVRYAKITLFPVSRVRGCGMNCEFCTVKEKPRYATPERLMEQFMSVAERWGARDFFIVDDLFGQDREDTLRLLRLLKEYQEKIRRSFFTTVQIRLDKAKDAEMLEAMRDANIRVVAIGFESPIPEELKVMNKHLRAEDMIAMTHQFHRHGFMVHGMFIFGYPFQQGALIDMPVKERIRHFRRFIRKARLDTIQVLLPVALPGTELTHRLAKEGRIFSTQHVGLEYYDGNFPLFIPDPPLTPEEMLVANRKIMGLFYRFQDMFSMGFNILSFPMIVFQLRNLHHGWRLWYKKWRNSKIRFGGWLVLRHWVTEFNRSGFMQKLSTAMQDRQQKPSSPREHPASHQSIPER